MKRLAPIAAGLLAAGFATGCSRQPVAIDRGDVRLVLAHPNLAIGEEVFLYAVPKRMGYFRDEGMSVSLKTSSSGSQAAQVMVTGGADIASMLAESLLSVREQGGDPVAFYQLKTNNGYSVSVLPGSPIRTLADLQGKTVGFTGIGYGIERLLRQQFHRLGFPREFDARALGSGPAVATALRSGQVDAIVMWDAIEQILENTGLHMRHIAIPVQDEIAGYQLATTRTNLRRQPALVGHFCRAVAKAMQFSVTNPEAAVAMFYDEYPSNVPAGVTREKAIQNGAKVLRAFLAKALHGIPVGVASGAEDPQRWRETSVIYHEIGQLYRTDPVEAGYTTALYGPCNDFDRAAVIAQAKATPAR